MKTQPYTYLLGWSNLNTYYYGVRYAEKCRPSELLETYFTSSKHVEEFIEQNGLPDIKLIRKTFENKTAARLWENKVLKRMNVVKRDDFLNKTDNISIAPEAAMKGSKAKKPFKTNDPRWETVRENGKNSKLNEILTPEMRKQNAQKAAKTFKSRPDYEEIVEKRNKKLKETIARQKRSGTYENSGHFTKDTGKKMAKKNNSDAECPHCNKTGQYRAMKRWHFDNCKLK